MGEEESLEARRVVPARFAEEPSDRLVHEVLVVVQEAAGETVGDGVGGRPQAPHPGDQLLLVLLHQPVTGAVEVDRLFEEALSIDVALLDGVMEMPGRFARMSDAPPEARFLRAADCTVRPDRIERFVETQHSVWRPGMAEAGGMLAGAFWSFRDRRDRFLVITLWTSEGAHADYVHTRFPLLRERARPGDDLVAVTGHAFSLVPEWTVIPRDTSDQKL